MKRIILTIGAIALTAGLAWAQNPPNSGGQQGQGGVRTPDMDPSKKPKTDSAKEFPNVNKQADTVAKDTKSFTAKAKIHEVNMSASLDVRTEADLKAKRVKGAEMWLLWDDGGSADKKNPAVRIQAVGKRLTYVWPDIQEFEKIEVSKKKEAWQPQLLFATLYAPSKLSEDFEIKLIQLALKYGASDASFDKPPEDPFSKKANEFDKEKPAQNSGGQSGPDPQVHHAIELVPKDAKLKALIPSIKIHVHMKTFAIAQAEVRRSNDGSSSITIVLSDFKAGAEVADKDVQLDTNGLKERVKK